MTDFYSVLQRAIASLPDGSGPQRRAVYDKARKALLKQLQSFDPPLPSSDVTAQRLALEDAIRKIENEIARQIRARRAVQGALPAAGTARPAGSIAAPQIEAPARPTPPAPPAPTPEELQAQRDQQTEAIASAVSQATALPPEPVPEPQSAHEPEPEREPEPQSVDTEALAGDIIAADTAAERDEWFGAPAQRRGRPEPRHDDLGFDGDGEGAPLPATARDNQPTLEAEIEGDDSDDEATDVAAAPAPVSARPRRSRNEEKRQRKEAERAAKAAERERKKAARRQRKAVDAPADKADKPKRAGRSVLARALLPLIVLALLVGASYAAYTQRATLLAMLDELSAPPTADTRAPIRAAPEGVSKNTDRLPTTLDGEETRPVTTTTVRSAPPAAQSAAPVREVTPPADDAAPQAEIVATPPPAAPAPTEPAAAPETDTEIADISGNASQQAVLYEEASESGEQGRATAGQVEWSMVRQSVAGGEPEPVVRADTRVASRNMLATITIRENRDSALPASHLIEIEIDQSGPDGDDPVKSIPGIIMKETEQSRGEALRGAAARVSSGLFWVALSENEADRVANLDLLRERDWIDIPILYESGRRAILTLRKGNEGVQSVNAALQAWSPG